MELLGQQIIAGIATGSIYSSFALAIVMIYQAMRHVNFAQGEMAMFASYIALQLILWGVPFWIAFIMTVGMSFFGGIIIERILIRPLLRSSVFSQVVMFIALLAVLNSGAGYIWGHEVVAFPSPFGFDPFLGVSLVSNHQAGVILITLLLFSSLFLFFRYTKAGLAMTAAASEPASAQLVGVRVGWMIALGWGMAAAIGAVAGMLIAPVVFLEPNMMLTILVYSFAGAVLGGLTSPGGAVVGGLLVGVIENLVGTYIPVIGGELKLTMALTIIVIMLIIRPRGLFGRLIIERV